MGQAKQKKQLNEQFINEFNKTPRQYVVDACRQAEQKYQEAMEKWFAENQERFSKQEPLQNAKEANEWFKTASYEIKGFLPWQMFCQFVTTGMMTVDQIKDAAWEGYDGLMQAEAVAAILRQTLGMPKVPVDISKFVTMAE